MTEGFWHVNFFPVDYWHEDYWQDYGAIIPDDGRRRRFQEWLRRLMSYLFRRMI